jgi:hypothetical protein
VLALAVDLTLLTSWVASPNWSDLGMAAAAAAATWDAFSRMLRFVTINAQIKNPPGSCLMCSLQHPVCCLPSLQHPACKKLLSGSRLNAVASLSVAPCVKQHTASPSTLDTSLPQTSLLAAGCCWLLQVLRAAVDLGLAAVAACSLQSLDPGQLVTY